MELIKAVRLFVEDLKLAEREKDLITAFLLASPVAVRGQQTMLPVQDAAKAIRVAPLNAAGMQRLNEAVREVAMTNKEWDTGRGWVSFNVFAEISIPHDVQFINFTISRTSCQVIQALVDRRDEENFDRE